MVADTVYVSFEAEVTDALLLLLEAADEHEGQRVSFEGNTADTVSTLPSWTAWKGRLSGFAGGFDHVVGGVGRWVDVRALIGPATPRLDGEPHKKALRRVYLMIGSSVLWRERGQGRGVYEVVRRTIDEIGYQGGGDAQRDAWLITRPADDKIRPARLDVCCDHWGHAWTVDDLNRFAARQRGSKGQAKQEDVSPEVIETPTGWAWSGRRGTTLYLGRRSTKGRFLRVYDKTEEAASSGKLPWLEPIWRKYGWQPGDTMWRAEVEHGGEWLRKHGMPTLAEMRDAERSLWEHYTTSVRHVVGHTAQLRHEKPSPAWAALMVAPANQTDGVWKWEPRRASGKRDCVQLLKQAAGCIARVEDEVYLGAAALRVVNDVIIPPPTRSTTTTRRGVLAMVGKAMVEKRKRDAVQVKAIREAGDRIANLENSIARTRAMVERRQDERDELDADRERMRAARLHSAPSPTEDHFAETP